MGRTLLDQSTGLYAIVQQMHPPPSTPSLATIIINHLENQPKISHL